LVTEIFFIYSGPWKAGLINMEGIKALIYLLTLIEVLINSLIISSADVSSNMDSYFMIRR